MAAQPAALAQVRIQTEDFDLSAEVAALHAADARVGAAVAFVGLVREWAPTLAAQAAALPPEGAHSSLGRPGAGVGSASTLGPEGSLDSLELEHYPGMTERAIEAMIDQARQRFEIFGARVVHRVGRLGLGEQIVLVAVTAAHRGEAFQASEFLMDYLKTQAPFWKKEHGAAGSRWVDARACDDAALAKWGLAASNASPS